MPVNCYSQRILNPFRGVMNIISIGGADAVTIDGSNWTLYIHDDFDCPTDDPQEFFEIEMPDIRFGEWHKKTGLKRSPLIASYHYNEIQAIGHALLQAVQQHAGRCPFPFADNYELWLLDKNTSEPLALVDSACHENEMQLPDKPSWQPGIRCKQEFLHEYSPLQTAPESAAETLTRMVNQRAGSPASAQWFCRNRFSYGKGLNGINISRQLVGRELSARLFPKMLLQQQWHDEASQSLVDAFINWLSPYLLVLDLLRDEQRRRLEITAGKHALLVDRMYPLYPKVINHQVINAARVEAMLRRSLKTDNIGSDQALDNL